MTVSDLTSFPASPVQALRAAVADVMAVEDVTEGVQAGLVTLLRRKQPEQVEHGDAVRLRGQLTVPSDVAYQIVAPRFSQIGFTPLLRKDEDRERTVILALPGTLGKATQRIAVAVVLFTLTVISCLFVGAQYVEGLTAVNYNLLQGWPYALSLLSILAAHEFGHYLVARYLGTPTSLPYFIPMPIGLGTMGAVINMTSPPRNRRHLLAIAAAGPLAGLALAIPILVIGLRLSHIEALPAAGGYQMEGNSLLYLGLKYLIFGQILPSNGQDVFIHQVAFAGWVGLLVTGLNLIPAGQLDGGHIVYALVGDKYARYILWAVLAVLVGLSFFYPGWLLWVGLIFLFGQVRATPLDEVTQLTNAQRLLAVIMVALFVLVFTPVPFKIVP